MESCSSLRNEKKEKVAGVVANVVNQKASGLCKEKEEGADASTAGTPPCPPFPCVPDEQREARIAEGTSGRTSF